MVWLLINSTAEYVLKDHVFRSPSFPPRFLPRFLVVNGLLIHCSALIESSRYKTPKTACSSQRQKRPIRNLTLPCIISTLHSSFTPPNPPSALFFRLPGSQLIWKNSKRLHNRQSFQIHVYSGVNIQSFYTKYMSDCSKY